MRALMIPAAAALLLTAPIAAQTIYETGFESPQFSAGALNGQDSWSATPTNSATVINGADAQAGSQYVRQSAGSSAERAFTTSAPSHVLVRAYHRGAGAASAQLPTDPAAAVIAFVSAGAGTYNIQALNGNGSGGGSFVTLNSSPFSTTTWNAVTIALDYGRSRYAASASNGTATSGSSSLGFMSAVTSLNGFRSSTEVGSDLDTFLATLSDGDFDNDGYADSVDVAFAGGNAFDAAARPRAFADKDGDGAVTTEDALSIRRAPVSGQFDIDGNGTSNAADGDLLYRWCIGDTTVPVIPPLN